eukprot:10329368-Lingulodinium_polyedra.AAC.1
MGAVPPIMPPTVWARCAAPPGAAVSAAVWAAQHLTASILSHSAHRAAHLQVRDAIRVRTQARRRPGAVRRAAGGCRPGSSRPLLSPFERRPYLPGHPAP